MFVIPPGPAISRVPLSAGGRVGHPRPSVQWGDVPTWVLAVVALAALIAAVAAYRKQADAARGLSRQVKLQADQLEDQRSANAKQMQVLDAQLREMQQRAESIERQQADATRLMLRRWSGPLPGIRTQPGPNFHMARVENQWHRPITNVVCRILPAPGDTMRVAALVGRMLRTDPSPLIATGFGNNWVLVDQVEGTKVARVRPGDGAGFVFIYEMIKYPDAQMTLRFTDDAGLHWQIDHDEHLEKLDNRDDW